MQQCAHLLTKGAIQTLGDPIELGCVMDGELVHSASSRKVLIELIAQVLSLLCLDFNSTMQTRWTASFPFLSCLPNTQSPSTI